MGSTIAEAWPEIANIFELAFAEAESTGRAISMENTPLFLHRHGYLEETYFSYSLIPVRGNDGVTEGFYVAGFETTRQKIWERRTST